MAVKANQTLDFFGLAVNIVSRVQSLAETADAMDLDLAVESAVDLPQEDTPRRLELIVPLASSLVKETPRLCRGGSKSLTDPGV